MRGNLERPGIVRRSTENPWTNSDTFTNRSPGNSEFKSYYLYTYEGLNILILISYRIEMTEKEQGE